MKKIIEKIIIYSGKPIYAISLSGKKTSGRDNSTHIFIESGKVRFSDSWFACPSEFNLGDDSHRIAKEMFISQLQVDIKCRILELKQLQAIFEDLNMEECLGPVMVDNTKILTDLKKEVSSIKRTTTKATKELAQVVEEVKENAKTVATEAIRENVRGLALKKPTAEE